MAVSFAGWLDDSDGVADGWNEALGETGEVPGHALGSGMGFGAVDNHFCFAVHPDFVGGVHDV